MMPEHKPLQAILSEEIQRLANIGSWERDVETGVILWSPEARSIVNAPEHITIEEYIDRYVHPDDRGYLRTVIREGLARGRGYEAEYRIVLDDGTQKDVRISTIIQSGTATQGKRVQGFIQDISSWKATQKELAEKRLLLKESQQIARIGGWEFDLDRENLVWTDEYYAIIERTREEYPPTIENFYNLIHPHDRQRVYEDMQQALRGRTNAIEYRILMADDSIKYIRGYGSVIRNESNHIIKLRGVIQDISDQKRSERQLRRLTELLNQAQHLTHLGSWERDLRSGELTWSDEFFRQLGYEPQQFIPEADDFYSHVHPDDLELIKNAIRALIANDRVQMAKRFIEYRIIRTDGSLRYMRGSGGNVLNAEGEVTIIFGTLQDITPEKEARLHLAASEAKFRRLFEQSSVGQIMYDRELRPVQVNTSLLNTLGYTAEEFLSTPLYSVLHPHDHHKFYEQMHALSLGYIPTLQADVRFVHKSGTPIWCHIQASLVHYHAPSDALPKNTKENAIEQFILVAVEDITQYRKIEEAIQKTLQRERELFEMRNQMVARLSHNVQTPLSTILLASSIMQKHAMQMPQEKMHEYLRSINEAVEEVQSLLGTMTFVGKLDTGRAQISLTAFSLTTFYKHVLGEFTTKFPHRPVNVQMTLQEHAAIVADHDLLRMIVWNILLFLDKGMPRGAPVDCAISGEEYHSSTQTLTGITWQFVSEAPEERFLHVLGLLDAEASLHDIAPELSLPTIQQAVRLHNGTLTAEYHAGKLALTLVIRIETQR